MLTVSPSPYHGSIDEMRTSSLPIAWCRSHRPCSRSPEKAQGQAHHRHPSSPSKNHGLIPLLDPVKQKPFFPPASMNMATYHKLGLCPLHLGKQHFTALASIVKMALGRPMDKHNVGTGRQCARPLPLPVSVLERPVAAPWCLRAAKHADRSTFSRDDEVNGPMLQVVDAAPVQIRPSPAFMPAQFAVRVRGDKGGVQQQVMVASNNDFVRVRVRSEPGELCLDLGKGTKL